MGISENSPRVEEFALSELDACHDEAPILKERPPELVEGEAEPCEPQVAAGNQGERKTRSDAKEDLPQFPEAHFKLMEILGEGGMGTVYRVRDENLQLEFAVKVLRPELARDKNLVSRFKKEAEAAAELSHANLATIYKTGECLDGRPYLVMDYVPGPSLATVLQQEGHLLPERALEIFIQICEVVEYAHSKGVIHRDLKPSNVLLVKEENLERIKLVDFGIARVLPHISGETLKLTTADQVLGSPLYMSPEQCQGDELGRQSDIYSLGCLMYEALTGRVPFLGDNAVKTILKHLNEEPAHLTVHLKSAELPRGLSPVVLKCLEKTPRDRYQTAHLLQRDLEAIREGKLPTVELQKKKAKPPKEDAKSILHITWQGALAAAIVGGAIFGAMVISNQEMIFKSAIFTPASEEKMLLRDLALEQTSNNVDYKKLADTSYKIALDYYRAGQYARAENYCKLAIAYLETKEGAQSVGLGPYLSKLASILDRQGQYEEAISTSKRALAIEEKALGPNHFKLAETLNTLAVACDMHGDAKDAEKYYSRAIELMTHKYADKNIRLSTFLTNYGEFHYARGRYKEAEALYRQALALQEKHLSHSHTNKRSYSDNLSRLALICQKQGKSNEAAELRKKSEELKAIGK